MIIIIILISPMNQHIKSSMLPPRSYLRRTMIVKDAKIKSSAKAAH